MTCAPVPPSAAVRGHSVLAYEVDDDVLAPLVSSPTAPLRMRTPFWILFQLRPDGTFTPRTPVRLGSQRVDPGTPIPRDTPLDFADFRRIAGRDLEVDEDGDVKAIKWVW